MLPSLSGVRLNCADVGRLLGVSRPTAQTYLRSLEEAGLVTRLPCYGGGRRQLLIARDDPSPRASLLRGLQAARPNCRFYWWRYAKTRVVDLVADLGDERVGFCFSAVHRPNRRSWQPLVLAVSCQVIHRGFLLHEGDHAFMRHGLPIIGLPLQLFMRQLGEWMFAWRAPARRWRAMTRVNRAAAGRAGRPGLPGCRRA